MCRTFCCLFNKGNKKGEKFETEYNDIVDRGWNVVSKPVYAWIQIKSDARECLEIRFPSRGMGLGLECVHEKERAILYGKIHQHFWEPDVKIIRILVEISKIWTNVCLKVRKIINVVFLNSKQGIIINMENLRIDCFVKQQKVERLGRREMFLFTDVSTGFNPITRLSLRKGG